MNSMTWVGHELDDSDQGEGHAQVNKSRTTLPPKKVGRLPAAEKRRQAAVDSLL